MQTYKPNHVNNQTGSEFINDQNSDTLLPQNSHNNTRRIPHILDCREIIMIVMMDKDWKQRKKISKNYMMGFHHYKGMPQYWINVIFLSSSKYRLTNSVSEFHF